ncbi:MAG TPA: hypothetical protein VGK99_00465 [Acidobacteriota bacterium]|jgi:hypothetical protein
MMTTRLRAVLLALAFLNSIVSVRATSYSGFLTPNFVVDQQAPYSPISASANLTIGENVTGHLRLRDRGNYRIQGTTEGARIRITLERIDGAGRGRAYGRSEPDRIELDLEIFDDRANPLYNGVLLLEANAHWLASPVFDTKKSVRDVIGRAWYEIEFDDDDWSRINLPDDNSFGDTTNRARYYRRRFFVADPDEDSKIVFSSDDGIWVYVNGHYVGRWGSKDGGGCVNDPLKRCGENGTVPPVSIPRSFLTADENVIAVKVNNGECCFTYFNLQITRVRTRIRTER